MTKFDEAAIFATKAHSGIVRKTESIPYILHPMEAAAIAATVTQDEDVLCAVILHDVVEDTDHTLEEIRERFGDRVANLVAAESENKRYEIPAVLTWQIRKEESLRELEMSTDPAVKILWLADKLSNIRALYRMWLKDGQAVFLHFHESDPAKQAWLYRTIVRLLSEFEYTLAWQELNRLVNTIFEGIESK
jgi:myo-inositol-1(or 4)-monophosphatase